jgi:transposase-like protein
LCGEERVGRNGKKSGKQKYLCRSCNKSFVKTTGSAMENSHYGESVWKQVIRDTIDGVSIDDTANSLVLHHETVFNMRHKILYSIEQEMQHNTEKLTGVCEADETFILENFKGKEFPDNFHRKPRKHGAKAEKRGISSEYICVCAAVERGGSAYSEAVNRAAPTKENIVDVFGERINADALVLCDGAKSYGILEEEGHCTVMRIKNEDKGFKKINNVNGFHSFIKERTRDARGFATKYLNRYLALFSGAYRKSEMLVDDIYKILSNTKNRYVTIAESQSVNLLVI